MAPWGPFISLLLKWSERNNFAPTLNWSLLDSPLPSCLTSLSIPLSPVCLSVAIRFSFVSPEDRLVSDCQSPPIGFGQLWSSGVKRFCCGCGVVGSFINFSSDFPFCRWGPIIPPVVTQLFINWSTATKLQIWPKPIVTTTQPFTHSSLIGPIN